MASILSASFSSLELLGPSDHQHDIDVDHDDLSTTCSCSCSSSEHRERWEPNEAAPDDCPGMPSRRSSNHSLNLLNDSQSTLISLESSTSITFTSVALVGTEDLIMEDDDIIPAPPQQVQRTISNDSLPQIPKRQASGRQLQGLGASHRSIRTVPVSPVRSARRGRKFGPPSIPRRQASGNDKVALAKSLSMPMQPTRSPSFKLKVRAGSAA